MHKDDNNLYNLVKRGMKTTDRTRKGFESYIADFSCYDFRVEYEAFGVTRSMLNWMVNKLRRAIPLGAATHIRDTRPLNVGTILVILRGPKLLEELRKCKLILEAEKYIPLARFLSSVSFTLDGRIILSYLAPRDIINEMLARIDSWTQGRESLVEVGETIPVHNCIGKIGLEYTDEIAKYFDSIRNYRLFRLSRMPILDYVLMSVLDVKPLISLTEIRNIMHAIYARIEKSFDSVSELLRHKYVLRHYRRLSEAKIVGRVKFSRSLWDKSKNVVVVFVSASSSCARKLYAILASILASSRMIITGRRVYAGMAIPTDLLPRISNMLAGCDLESHVVIGGKVSPFPFEMFDPRRNEWRMEPVDVLEYLKRSRVLG